MKMLQQRVHTPSEASAEGLNFIKPKLNEMQAAILAFLKFRAFHGATDSEIAHQLEIGDNARKRRGELCKQGYVVAINMKRPACDSLGSATGPTNQTVWVASEFAPNYAHTSQDLKRLEDRLSSLITAARRIKRILRKGEPTSDELYSKHTVVAEAYTNYVMNFHVAWRGLRPPDSDMMHVGDVINTSRGHAKIVSIDRTTEQFGKYGNDVESALWSDARKGFVVVVTDNGHWQYGHTISPVDGNAEGDL